MLYLVLHRDFIDNVPFSDPIVHLHPDVVSGACRLNIFAFDLHGIDGHLEIWRHALDGDPISDFNFACNFDNTNADPGKVVGDLPYLFQTFRHG